LIDISLPSQETTTRSLSSHQLSSPPKTSSGSRTPPGSSIPEADLPAESHFRCVDFRCSFPGTGRRTLHLWKLVENDAAVADAVVAVGGVAVAAVET